MRELSRGSARQDLAVATSRPPSRKDPYVGNHFDVTTAVVVVTILVGLSLSGGAVWIAFKNERLGAALLVGIAVAALVYGLVTSSVQ